jgi:uncharacterized protein (TIGR03435 family)
VIVSKTDLLRICLLGAGGMLVLGCVMFRSLSSAQTKVDVPVSPQFEVASIKPSNPAEPRPGRLGSVSVGTSPGRLTVRNAYLKELIKGAYGLEDYQVSGGPDWIASARFDVEAKSADSANRARLLLMLQALLVERFKLASHHEKKELAVYAITVAKNGPKFQRLTASQASCWPACTDSPAKTNTMRQRDLPSLATFLTRLGSDRPVIDQTGLVGSFALEVDMSPIFEEAAAGGAAPTNGIQLFEGLANAIQDKLGLKLAPTKASVETLVVDHAEKPSGN